MKANHKEPRSKTKSNENRGLEINLAMKKHGQFRPKPYQTRKRIGFEKMLEANEIRKMVVKKIIWRQFFVLSKKKKLFGPIFSIRIDFACPLFSLIDFYIQCFQKHIHYAAATPLSLTILADNLKPLFSIISPTMYIQNSVFFVIFDPLK